MDNTELTKILLSQIQERDDMIKTLTNNMIKLSDAYIVKDKEKDKRHANTLRTVIISCLITITFVICFFTGSYFWSDYQDYSTINGNGNSTMLGDNNTNTQNGGAE